MASISLAIDHLMATNRNREPFPAPDLSLPGSGPFIAHASLRDQGPARATLEDTVAAEVPEDASVLAQKGCLFTIADGVGGYGGGDIASREAAAAFSQAYYADRAAPERAIKGALGEANLRVYDLAIEMKHPNLSTTLSGIAIVGSRFHLVHIGDSRVYRLRPRTEIELLTEDHSEAWQLVKMQILSPSRVRSHPRRHVLTRSLGSNAIARPTARSGDVQPGDIFVQCTDGVWEVIEDEEISAIVRMSPPEQACRSVIDLCLSRSPGDNMSIQVIRVLAVDETAPRETGGFRQAVMRLFSNE